MTQISYYDSESLFHQFFFNRLLFKISQSYSLSQVPKSRATRNSLCEVRLYDERKSRKMNYR